jgi:hypothetical protein
MKSSSNKLISEEVFTYPLFFKLIYRYGNIPLTLFLSFYLIISVIKIDTHIYFIFPIVIILLLIYFLNKHYLNLYKILPYKIIADDEKITCSNFLFQKKKIIIFYNDIGSLTGGIFSGKFTGVMKVFDGKNKHCIGFFEKLKNVNRLQTIILSKVRKEVYDSVIENVGLTKKK